jgi:ATP-dependent RNA circularization protein (DNA/RNA ligase family)
MKYPKIQTLFKRHAETWKIIEGDYSFPELDLIDVYEVYEKIDGTNIRIMWNGHKLEFRGRTDQATIPPHLLEYLKNTFTIEKMKNVFPEYKEIILYGEGYGHKIQAVGKYYREDVGFILFDCFIGMWLEYESLQSIAGKLEIPIVPCLGIWDKDEITEYVRSKPNSIIAQQPVVTEGIIAKAHMGLLTRNGNRIIFKLKCSDYN